MAEHNHHHHTTSQKGKPLFIAITLNLLITVAQVFGGVVSGSLSLIGDALHNFSDVLSLIISYVANALSGKKSTEKRTFGFKRAQILAAFINAITLIGISVFLIIEAVERLIYAQGIVQAGYVIWLAVLGILVNGASVLLLTTLQKGDSNLRAAFLHLVGDLVTSFAVLAGGLAMKFYQVYWVDSVITIGVSLYLIIMASQLFIHTINVLMQFVPSHLNVRDICERVMKIPGVHSLHHVHLWRLNDDAIHFEAHVVIQQNISLSEFDRIKKEVNTMLRTEFEIDHCILQPEFSECADNELVPQE